MELGKPVSDARAQAFLQDPFLRLVFLDEYDYFGRDSNDALYRQYVMTAFRQRKNLEYALDLAIAAEIFEIKLVPELKRLLSANAPSSIKLSCLDYVLCFRKKLGTNKVVSLAKLAESRSANVHVRVTALLILAMYYRKTATDAVIREIEGADVPSVIYRVLNIVNTTKELSYMRKELFEQLQNIISTLKTKQAQRKELLEMMNL